MFVPWTPSDIERAALPRSSGGNCGVHSPIVARNSLVPQGGVDGICSLPVVMGPGAVTISGQSKKSKPHWHWIGCRLSGSKRVRTTFRRQLRSKDASLLHPKTSTVWDRADFAPISTRTIRYLTRFLTISEQARLSIDRRRYLRVIPSPFYRTISPFPYTGTPRTRCHIISLYAMSLQARSSRSPQRHSLNENLHEHPGTK